MNKRKQALRTALNALNLAQGCHGVMLLSDPPKDAWKYHNVSTVIFDAIDELQKEIAREETPIAWGMRSEDGSISDCICPEEHERLEGSYTVPLYTYEIDE